MELHTLNIWNLLRIHKTTGRTEYLSSWPTKGLFNGWIEPGNENRKRFTFAELKKFIVEMKRNPESEKYSFEITIPHE